jgi:hypothetical protein
MISITKLITKTKVQSKNQKTNSLSKDLKNKKGLRTKNSKKDLTDNKKLTHLPKVLINLPFPTNYLQNLYQTTKYKNTPYGIEPMLVH